MQNPNLSTMTHAELLAYVAKLEAEKQAQGRALLSVKDKGTVHYTGVNQPYGVALYPAQWRKLLSDAAAITDFLDNVAAKDPRVIESEAKFKADKAAKEAAKEAARVAKRQAQAQ